MKSISEFRGEWLTSRMSHFRHSFVKKKTSYPPTFRLVLCAHKSYILYEHENYIYSYFSGRPDPIWRNGGEPDVCRGPRRKSVFSLSGIARTLRPAISPVFPSQLLMAMWPHTHFGLLARQIAAAQLTNRKEQEAGRGGKLFFQRSITSLEHALTHLLLMSETTLKNLCVVVWELVYTNKHQPPSSYRCWVVRLVLKYVLDGSPSTCLWRPSTLSANFKLLLVEKKRWRNICTVTTFQ